MVGKKSMYKKPRNGKQFATKDDVKKAISTSETRSQATSGVTSFQNVSYDSPYIASLLTFNAVKRLEIKQGVRFRGYIRSGAVCSRVRVILFQWLASNATAPTIADILAPYVGSVDTASEVLNGDYNFYNRSNYKILFDKGYSLSDFASTNDTRDGQTRLDVLIPLKRLQRKYVIMADDAESGRKGQLYVLAVSDQTDAGTPALIEWIADTVVHDISAE